MIIVALFPELVAIGGDKTSSFLSVRYGRPLTQRERREIPLSVESVMGNRRFPVKVQMGYNEIVFTPKVTRMVSKTTLETHYRAILKLLDICVHSLSWDPKLQP